VSKNANKILKTRKADLSGWQLSQVASTPGFKMGDIIMFAMVSSSPNQVPPRVDRCLEGQFACAPMYNPMFSAIVNVTNGCSGGGCSVCFGDEKGFNVGFNIKLP
jgi:hypothetical protein